jgi:hypothetical protein
MRLFIYDKTQSCLTASWWFGAALRSLRPGPDEIVTIRSWTEMVVKLKKIPPKTVERVEYWGHGSTGRVLCDHHAIGLSRGYEYLRQVNHILTGPEALWFWRTCSTFHGVEGKDFARSAGLALGCRQAGFRHRIWAFQSGLEVVEPPDLTAEWSNTDGRKWSWPWLRGKTVFCLARGVD